MVWTHDINPVILNLGGLQVRWYGLMYVIGFLIAGQILNKLSKEGFLKFTKDDIDKYITSMMIGMFLGARLAYVFVYNWDYYSNNLGDMFSVWKGGLSFHGAIIGFLITMMIWAKKKKVPYFMISDATVLCGTIGLFFGRLGNYINGELYGRVTNSDFGVIFGNSGGGPFPRHPSQLYEAFFEGIVLFLILWLAKPKAKRYGVLTAIYMMGYGFFRYCIEFFREADSQLGYYFGGTTTMGQILCLIMFLGGVAFYFIGKKQDHQIS